MPCSREYSGADLLEGARAFARRHLGQFSRLHGVFFFFFNDTATTEIYTLSLHDALPISTLSRGTSGRSAGRCVVSGRSCRSEEHTSELQSPVHLVCRLLLEKKKKPL